MRAAIFGLLLMLAVAHQDFWWRADHRTLVLGFLPVSFTYHVLISIAACILWGMACRYCWPHELDVEDGDNAASGKAGH